MDNYESEYVIEELDDKGKVIRIVDSIKAIGHDMAMMKVGLDLGIPEIYTTSNYTCRRKEKKDDLDIALAKIKRMDELENKTKYGRTN